MRLEKYQGNAIFRAIETGGLDLTECGLTEGEMEVRVSHVPSGSSFVITRDGASWRGHSVVGNSAIQWPYTAQSTEALADKVRVWAMEVKNGRRHT